jgi:hypothetical protein
MSDAPRMDVETAHRKVVDGEALLICAYEDEERCQSVRLEGSIMMKDLMEQLPWLPREQELIFYCA